MNRTEVLELRRNRAALVEQARTILNAATVASRSLTTEEQVKWDAIHADADALKTRIDREERQASLEAELTESTRETPRSTEQRVISPVTQTRAERLASSEYDQAFRAMLIGSQTPEQRQLVSEFRTAQGVGSGGIGGYVVPQGFRATLIEAMKAFGGMRSARSTQITTDSGNDLPIPTLNDTSNTGELIAENTAVTEQGVTFSNKTLNAYKFSSKSVLVSFELLQDSAIDVNGLLAKTLGTRLGRIQNTYFTTGTGTSQPQGAVAGATLGKTAASATALTYLELIDLIHSVDMDHRKTAQFMFNDGVLKAVKQLVDSQGRPLWLPSVAVGEPDSIVGYPYVINQDMQATLATGTKTVLFGDFSYYYIRDVMDVQLFKITDKYVEQGSVGFLAYLRSDGKYVNPGSNPIKYLIQA